MTEKGGKQDNSQWLKFCSVCNSEFEERKGKEFVNQNPEFRNLMNRLKENQGNLQKIGEKIEQAVGKEKWKKIGEEVREELEEEFSDIINQLKQNSGNGNQNDNGNLPRNNQDNSAKITKLQQEINSLKQEISDLKKPHNNSSPPNPETLREKENKLSEKKRNKKKEMMILLQINNLIKMAILTWPFI